MPFKLTKDADNTIIVRRDAKLVILFSFFFFCLEFTLHKRQDSIHFIPFFILKL